MHILGHLQVFSAMFWPVIGSLGAFEKTFRKSLLKEVSGIFCNRRLSDIWQFGVINIQAFSVMFGFNIQLLQAPFQFLGLFC